MEEMSVANTNAVLMSNIQVMALGNLVGDDIMVGDHRLAGERPDH